MITPHPSKPTALSPLDNRENPMTTNETPRYDSHLGEAIAIWRSGRNISLTLAAKLMQDGYDVPSLERRHRQ